MDAHIDAHIAADALRLVICGDHPSELLMYMVGSQKQRWVAKQQKEVRAGFRKWLQAALVGGAGAAHRLARGKQAPI